MIASPIITQYPASQPPLCPDQPAFVRSLCDGDPDAFQRIDEMYRARLHRFAMKILRSPQDAEDAVQDTFLRAFLKFDTFHCRSSIYTWLTSILVNCCLAHLRRNKKHTSLRSLDEHGFGDEPWSSLVISDQSSSEEDLIQAEQVEILHRAIRSLRADFRFIVGARTDKALSLDEIAEQLQLSLPATKSRALRARKQVVRNARLIIGMHTLDATSQRRYYSASIAAS